MFYIIAMYVPIVKIYYHLYHVHQSKDDIHFLSIDKRKRKGDEVYIVLENGSEILLPKNITKVPSIMLLNRNNKVLEGEDVQKHFDLMIDAKKTHTK